MRTLNPEPRTRSTVFTRFHKAGQGSAQFGTGVESSFHNTPNDNAMFTQMKRYLKLKQAATRLMVAGDVQRYLHALRLMHDLRTRTGAVA